MTFTLKNGLSLKDKNEVPDNFMTTRMGFAYQLLNYSFPESADVFKRHYPRMIKGREAAFCDIENPEEMSDEKFFLHVIDELFENPKTYFEKQPCRVCKKAFLCSPKMNHKAEVFIHEECREIIEKCEYPSQEKRICCIGDWAEQKQKLIEEKAEFYGTHCATCHSQSRGDGIDFICWGIGCQGLNKVFGVPYFYCGDCTEANVKYDEVAEHWYSHVCLTCFNLQRHKVQIFKRNVSNHAQPNASIKSWLPMFSTEKTHISLWEKRSLPFNPEATTEERLSMTYEKMGKCKKPIEMISVEYETPYNPIPEPPSSPVKKAKIEDGF